MQSHPRVYDKYDTGYVTPVLVGAAIGYATSSPSHHYYRNGRYYERPLQVNRTVVNKTIVNRTVINKPQRQIVTQKPVYKAPKRVYEKRVVKRTVKRRTVKKKR